MPSVLCCPKCGNHNLQMVTETKIKNEKCSFWGRFRYMLLYGACKDENSNYFICPDCGYKIEDPYDLRKKIDSCNVPIVGTILVIIGILVAILLYLIFTVVDRQMGSLLALLSVTICIVLGIVIEIWRRFHGEKIKKRIYEIQKSIEK